MHKESTETDQNTLSGLTLPKMIRALELDESQALMVLGADGVVVDATTTASHLFGYRPADLISLRFSTLIPQRFAAGHGELLELACRSGMDQPITRPFVGVHHDGSEFHAELSVVIDRQQDHGGLVLRIHDRDAYSVIQRAAETERRYSDLFDATTDIIQITDIDGRIVYTNPMWRKTLGYVSSVDPALTVASILAPEFQARYRDVMERVITGETQENVELEFVSCDRRRIFVEGSIAPRWRGAEIVGSQGFFRDVSARRKDERQIRELNERLSRNLESISDASRRKAAAWDQAMDGVAILDTDGNCQYLNKAHVEMFGLEHADDMLGRHWTTFYGKDVAEELEHTAFPHLKTHGYWTGEVRAMRKGHGEFLEEVSLKYVSDVGVVCICRDISERKQAEHELRLQREALLVEREQKRQARRLNEIVRIIVQRAGNDLPDAMVSQLSQHLEVRSAFVATRHKSDRTRLNVVAASGDAAGLSGMTYAVDDAPCGEILKSGTALIAKIDYERYPGIRSIEKTGISHYVGVPVIDSYGETVGVIGLLNDKPVPELEFITDLMQLFANRISAEWELERRTTLLKQSQKMEVLGRMAGGIAHDFNNLLSIMLGNLEMIAEEKSDWSGDHEDMFSDIYTSSCRARDLMKQLLDFSRQRNVDIQHVQVLPVLEEFRQMASRLVPATQNLRFNIADVDATTCVRSDQAMLQSVLLNLINNAVDAQESGGQINVSAIPDHEWLMITVTDQGVGIGQEHIEHVFEPFFTTKGAGAGTGLGLAMAAEFVRKSGGTIDVESDPGNGTTFSIRLPLVTGMKSPGPSASDREYNFSELHVLVVDDEPGMIRIIERFLSRTGAKLHFANDAEQAWHVVTGETPVDVVISDIDMPGEMNGFEFFRKMDSLRHVPDRLLITGKQNFKPSAVEFPVLTKPFTRSALLQRLLDILESPPISS